MFYGATLLAQQPATQMSPFKVEAEFGVDGVRIQPSQALLNSYQLEQHGVAQMQDITGIAPNLFVSSSDSRGFGDILSLRGVTNSIFFSSPGVALYVDDVPHASVSSYPTSLLGIDSLTVKAGPQGYDYGRNAAGGVIDIKTRAPGGSHQGTVLAEYGTDNLVAFQAAVDGPISSKAGYAASFGYLDRDGYIDNTVFGGTEDDRRSYAGRASIYLKPTNDLQLRFGLVAEKIEDGGQRLSSLFSPDRYKVQSDVRGQTDIDRTSLSFQLRKKFAIGSLIATTARSEFDLDPAITDLDLSPLPSVAAWSRVAQNEEIWSQEIRFESAPAANKAQWRAGLFWSDIDTDGDSTRQFVVPPIPPFVPISSTQTERTMFEIDQQTVAAYANADHPITTSTVLKVGLRAERAKSSIDRSKLASNSVLPLPPEARLQASQTDDHYAGSVGVVHSASKSVSLHARTAVAYKPEGYSGFTANPALARFQDEQQWANEIGITFGNAQSRVGGSLTGFWTKIDDYQFERTVPGSTDFVVVNAAEVISKGAEAKLMASPVDNLWWDVQLGFTSATFNSHRDASGASVDGNYVPYVPRSTLRTGLTYDFGGGLSANASYASIGRTRYDERNTSRFTQSAYNVVNAQIRYRVQNFTVTVYGQNLLGEDYYQFINPEIFAGSPGAPRRYGVQVSLQY